MSRRRYYPILLALLGLFLLSGVADKEQQTKYFEGVVVYQIDYISPDERFTAEQLRRNLGSRMVLTFRKGNYKKEYLSPQGELLRQSFLDLQKKKAYQLIPGSDTVTWFNITKPDSRTDFTRLEDQEVLNHKCRVIATQTKVGGAALGNRTFEVEGKYYYAQDMPVNPSWYRYYREANFNELIKEAKGIEIKSVFKGIFWERHMMMQVQEERKVSKKEISVSIPGSAVLIEL